MNSRYKAELQRHSISISKEEERELIRQAKAGDSEAHDRLFGVYIRYITAVLSRYLRKFNLRVLEDGDAIGWAEIAFASAVTDFDPEYEKGEASFAGLVGTRLLQVAYAQLRPLDSLVQLPGSIYKDREEFKEARETCKQELERSPTPAEIAAEMTARRRDRGRSEPQVSIQYVKDLQQMKNPPFSLSDQIPGMNGLRRIDLLKSERPPPSRKAERKSSKAFLDKLIECAGLTTQEKEILRRRFGIRCEYAHTLGQTAAAIAENGQRLTDERIRQLEKQALAKLRGSQEEFRE